MTRFSRVEDLRVSIFMLFFAVNIECVPFAIRCLMSPGPVEVDLQDLRKFLEHGLVHHPPSIAPPTKSRSSIFFAQAAARPRQLRINAWCPSFFMSSAQPDEQKKTEFIGVDNNLSQAFPWTRIIKRTPARESHASMVVHRSLPRPSEGSRRRDVV